MNNIKYKYIFLSLLIIILTSCSNKTTNDINELNSSISIEEVKLQNTTTSINSLESTQSAKFSFPFNIDNKELNKLIEDKYNKSATEKQFYESLDEIGFSTNSGFSKNDIDVLLHCKKIRIELLCPVDLSLFSELKQLEFISICEGAESAFVSTEKRYVDDYSFLKSLTDLCELRLINAEIDISLLEEMHKLKSLTIGESIIRGDRKIDLSSLESACFAYCDFDDMELLTSFYNICELEMDFCHYPKGQIQVLNTLSQLTKLSLTNCDLSELTDLSSLERLKILNIYTYPPNKFPPKELLNNIPLVDTLIIQEEEFDGLQLELGYEIISYR